MVTAALDELVAAGNQYDLVITIGPLIMMKFVVKTCQKHGLKSIVSMNPIMIDGTGMCGGCRLTVGGQTKFACVGMGHFLGSILKAILHSLLSLEQVAGCLTGVSARRRASARASAPAASRTSLWASAAWSAFWPTGTVKTSTPFSARFIPASS